MCTHTFVICIVFKNALKARINEAKTSHFHLQGEKTVSPVF